MKRITKYRYQVYPEEEVTIICTPISAPDSTIAIAVDDRPLMETAGSPPTYQFIVTKQPQTLHIGHVLCRFRGSGMPGTARFELSLRGSLGGDFCGPTVMLGDDVPQALTFEVLPSCWSGN